MVISMSIKFRTMVSAIILVLLAFSNVIASTIATTSVENYSSMSCAVVENNVIHVRLDITINKTLNVTKDLNLSLYNITKYAFKNNSLEFLNAIYEAYNKSITKNLHGEVTFPVIHFDDMTNSVSILFDVSGIFSHPKLEKYGTKLTLINGYTFTMSWKNTRIETSINVSLPAFSQYNFSYVLWNSTDVFVFDKLKEYPIERWNVTEGNFVIANVSIANSIIFIGNISLPKAARYIALNGENITYFYPIPIKESIIPIFLEAGALVITIGIVLFIITSRISYEKKVLSKFEKKKKKKRK